MKKIVEQVSSFYDGHRKKLLIMRNVVLILLASAFQVLATGSYSQTTQLNLNLKNATVKEVLNEIENQSEFYFLYNSELIDVNRTVNVSVKNEKIDELLARLFSEDEVNVLINNRYIVLSPAEETSVQQQNTISGRVTDRNMLPLPGVTVLVKGTTTGTITNSDGNYTLPNIPVGATLVFSFVGMKTQEILVGTQANISISMEEESIGLEEVVAVGYGTTRKKDVTGAVATISSEEFESRSTVQIGDALQGKIAGVQISKPSGQPQAGYNIRVRGGINHHRRQRTSLYR